MTGLLLTSEEGVNWQEVKDAKKGEEIVAIAGEFSLDLVRGKVPAWLPVGYGEYVQNNFAAAIVLWGFEAMKTGGDTIAAILELLGVRLKRRAPGLMSWNQYLLVNLGVRASMLCDNNLRHFP